MGDRKPTGDMNLHSRLLDEITREDLESTQSMIVTGINSSIEIDNLESIVGKKIYEDYWRMKSVARDGK